MSTSYVAVAETASTPSPHSPKAGVREDREVEILPLLAEREGMGVAGNSNNLRRLIYFTFLMDCTDILVFLWVIFNQRDLRG